MTCQQAVEAISRSVDAPLSASGRVGLGVHTFFCGPCRRFKRQMARLQIACKAVVQDEADSPATAELSAEARERIATALEKS